MKQLVLFRTLLEAMPIGKTVIGVVKDTKMDPNYVVIDVILPNPNSIITSTIVYKPRLTFLPLTTSDLTGITSFEQFQQTYPEYFI